MPNARGEPAEAPVGQRPPIGAAIAPATAARANQAMPAWVSPNSGLARRRGTGGPEQAEREVEAELVGGPALQEAVRQRQLQHRPEQSGIAEPRAWLPPGQEAGESKGQQRGCCRRKPEHHRPRGFVGDQARDGPRQHDAQHQPARHGSHDPAAERLGRQVGRERNQHLHHDRTQADRQHGGEERGHAPGIARRKKCDRADGQNRRHEAPVFDADRRAGR